MILPVTRQNIHQAAAIHSESWKESHKDLCSAEFLEAHTPERQKSYLEAEMEQGAQIYMLVDQKPVGIVSVQAGLPDCRPVCFAQRAEQRLRHTAAGLCRYKMPEPAFPVGAQQQPAGPKIL